MRYMSEFHLTDWNDIRLLLACAEGGSFAAAAAMLGLDQTTVSRRIAILEAAAGRPLFNRRRSGATLTPAGEVVLDRARRVRNAILQFDDAVGGLVGFPSPTVTIAASEGVLTYLVIPALLGSPAEKLPLDRGLLRQPPPDLSFVDLGHPADITVAATNPGDLPPVRGAQRVRRVGTMTFVPVAGQDLLRQVRPPQHFDDLARMPLMDIGVYRGIRALGPWHDLIAAADPETVLQTENTAAVQKPLVVGRGVTILPAYSPLYDPRVVVLDIPTPRLAVDLWMIAHEDKLREPAIRLLFDSLADMFLKSRWFRG